MKTLNWKEVGRFLSVIQDMYVVIRDGLSSMGIGLEILEWITGDGKEKFVEEFLKPLGKQFLATQRIIVVDENTIRVNLDAPPILPFDGATVKTNKGGGWVEVQKRADGLYIDGRKVIQFRSECQKGDKVIKGYELRDEVKNLPVLHPNIMDALYEHGHLIPEEWKYDENGNIIYTFFWAVRYGDSDGSGCVRYLSWRSSGARNQSGVWNKHYLWVTRVWCDRHPAAVLASLSVEAEAEAGN